MNYNGKRVKAFLISMRLFAVVVADVARRAPANKTETAKSTIAENEVEKGPTDETRQSMSAACRKAKKASAEDWAAVRAIVQEQAAERTTPEPSAIPQSDRALRAGRRQFRS